MLEIPESATLGEQVVSLLSGRTIVKVTAPTNRHRFTWYNGDPENYPALLEGRRIESARGCGAFVDILFDRDVHLLIGDGTNMRRYPAFEKHPTKHQLLVTLDDGGFLVFTVAMYGCIYAFRGGFDNPYYQGSLRKTSPLSDAFDRRYFDALLGSQQKDLSAKALLATGQRIPGLGNGTLQDILFNAGIHPKRKLSTLGDLEKSDLFDSLKTTLAAMTAGGGRDTEKDLLGNPGGYRTILSRNTCKEPCPNCGGTIVKKAYLGGAVYYCPVCQPLTKN